MRPYPITVLCVLLFMTGAFQCIKALAFFFAGVSMYSLFLLTVTLLAMMSFYGLWQCQRWAVSLFLAVWPVKLMVQFMIEQAPTLRTGMHLWFSVALLIAYVLVVLPHWSSLKGTTRVGADQTEI